MDLKFKENEKILTIGVEMEIQLINCKSFNLEPSSEKILQLLNHDKKIIKEMFQSTIEIISDPQENTQNIKYDLLSSIKKLEEITGINSIQLASTGTHPTANYNKRLINKTIRYQNILEKNQWLIRRMAVYGLHIHIGMKNGDECMKFMHFYNNLIPHLIALSASSPFWNGKDTGLDASRTTVYESHPTAGIPIFCENWNSFSELYSELLSTNSIESMKDIWWDIRPSPLYGTLEIRICDMPPNLEELISIVSFVHMLAIWFENLPESQKDIYLFQKENWKCRENKWRALRYGIDATFIKSNPLRSVSLKEDLLNWLNELKPISEYMNYKENMTTLYNIILKGNSATRQRRIKSVMNSFEKVILHNINEFKLRQPIWN